MKVVLIVAPIVVLIVVPIVLLIVVLIVVLTVLMTVLLTVVLILGCMVPPAAVMLLLYGVLWPSDGVLYGLGDYPWMAKVHVGKLLGWLRLGWLKLA